VTLWILSSSAPFAEASGCWSPRRRLLSERHSLRSPLRLPLPVAFDMIFAFIPLAPAPSLGSISWPPSSGFDCILDDFVFATSVLVEFAD